MSSRRRRSPSFSEDESPRPRRRNTHRDPPTHARHSDYEDYPRDRNRHRAANEGRRRGDGYATDDDYNRSRRNRHEEQYEYPRNRYEEHCERPRNRHEEQYEYGPGPAPRRYTDRERPRRRDDYDREPYGRDGRYRDDRYRDRDRDLRRGQKDAPEWQRQAKNVFMKHALPVIKKEGPRLIAKYLASRK